MDDKWTAIWNLINTGGVIALLFVNLVLLLRGDILPRRVYEDLLSSFVDRLCQKLLDAVRTLIREEMGRRKPGPN